MLFKKEFDIDKDFFEENEPLTSKRKLAIRVFIFVLILTFGILCYSAFTFNLNFRFGKNVSNNTGASLKEAQEYFFQAVKEYEAGNFDKAVQTLNKQLKIVDDPDAYNYLAKIYLERGDKERAIDNLQKSLNYKPDGFEANYELGKIYYNSGDFKSASKYLTAASNVKSDNSELLSLTAECYKQTGHTDDAIILFKKILELEPLSAFANTKIGEIYYQRLQYKEAASFFEDALKSEFDENTALQLAKCYLELNSLDVSLDIANEILEENKDNEKALALKKAIEYKKGNTARETSSFPVKNIELPMDKEALNAYIKEIENPIKLNWTPPLGSNLRKASVKFTVDKDGKILSSSIYTTSGMAEFDKSALEAIELSNPLPPLPAKLNRTMLDIIFTFDFNIKD